MVRKMFPVSKTTKKKTTKKNNKNKQMPTSVE